MDSFYFWKKGNKALLTRAGKSHTCLHSFLWLRTPQIQRLEAENDDVQKPESPLKGISFSGSILKFQGCKLPVFKGKFVENRHFSPQKFGEKNPHLEALAWGSRGRAARPRAAGRHGGGDTWGGLGGPGGGLDGGGWVVSPTNPRWWLQIFFIFTPIWGRFPFWLIFFNWVETTN